MKVNRFTAAQPRFVIFTNIWMINAKASFDKVTGRIEFEKLKWRAPISSLKSVTIKEVGGKLNIIMITDLEKQNQKLTEYNYKKVKKVERKFNFNDLTTFRDFIFHLKRIYHFHNCAGIDNKTPPLKIDVQK